MKSRYLVRFMSKLLHDIIKKDIKFSVIFKTKTGKKMWSNPKWKALIMELSFIDWSRLDFDQPFKIACVLSNSNSHDNLAN